MGWQTVKRYIFGFDVARPEACAAELRAHGFDAVVVGAADARTPAALAEYGLELYLCYGAYGVGANADASVLCRDAAGAPRRWFGSGCPNDTVTAEAHLSAALEKLRRVPSARGLIVDGARFASFASTEGPLGFFTCFCPRCLARIGKMGFDPERMRAAVLRLMERRCFPSEDAPALREWFAFRAACIQDYFKLLAEAVHALPGKKQAGAFVFAPSLGGFVGQTAAAMCELDLVAPMLYRAYPHADGPACLGHEWAAAKELFDDETLSRLAALADNPGELFPEKDAAALRREGLSPARPGAEIAALADRLAPGQRLLPILQIEDEALEESASAVLDAGADGFGLFMYGQAELPQVGVD